MTRPLTEDDELHYAETALRKALQGLAAATREVVDAHEGLASIREQRQHNREMDNFKTTMAPVDGRQEHGEGAEPG